MVTIRVLRNLGAEFTKRQKNPLPPFTENGIYEVEPSVANELVGRNLAEPITEKK